MLSKGVQKQCKPSRKRSIIGEKNLWQKNKLRPLRAFVTVPQRLLYKLWWRTESGNAGEPDKAKVLWSSWSHNQEKKNMLPHLQWTLLSVSHAWHIPYKHKSKEPTIQITLLLSSINRTTKYLYYFNRTANQSG